jgi:hypothetical protein
LRAPAAALPSWSGSATGSSHLPPDFRRQRGWFLAIAVAAAATGYQHQRYDDPHIVFDRFNLPGFDSYVYLAIAERPGFFTVAPWGYRVLTPWLAHALPADPVKAFRQVSLAGLFVAGVLLFGFLRRLGHAELPALLAMAAFGFSSAAGEPVRYPFLAEPVCIALMAALLLALESRAGAGRLALVLVLGALAKEIFILFLPGVFLALRTRKGTRAALAETALAALPAIGATLILRYGWVRVAGGDAGPPAFDTVWQGAQTVARAWSVWWQPMLLGGVTPLAVVGALLPAARGYLARYGYFVLLGYALPLAAAVYTGEGEPQQFFSRDVPRLLLYALPVALPLCLIAVDRWWTQRAAVPDGPWPRRLGEAAAGFAAAALMLAPLFVVDRYRRIDLAGRRSGPYVLGLCRGTLRTAARVESGQVITWDPESRRFVPGQDHPGHMDHQRWFLWDGWGSEPYFGVDDIVMRSERAALLIPALRPVDLDVVLSADAPREMTLELWLNGGSVGELPLGPDRRDATVRLPAALLFRGDNLLQLVGGGKGSALGVRLLAVRLQKA